jgi:hypothetical protein
VPLQGIGFIEEGMSIEQMTQHADAVVSGHVLAEQGSQTSTQESSLIYTNFPFQVDEWIAGGPSVSTVLLHQAGGASGFTPFRKRGMTRPSRKVSKICSF